MLDKYLLLKTFEHSSNAMSRFAPEEINNSNFDIIGKKDCNTGINNYDHLCKHSAFIISIRKKNNSNLKVNYKLLSNYSSVNQLNLKYKEKKINQIIKEQKKLKKIFKIKNYNFDKKM